MDVEEGHDEEGPVLAREVVRADNVLHCGNEVGVGKWDTLRRGSAGIDVGRIRYARGGDGDRLRAGGQLPDRFLHGGMDGDGVVDVDASAPADGVDVDALLVDCEGERSLRPRDEAADPAHRISGGDPEQDAAGQNSASWPLRAVTCGCSKQLSTT